MCLGVFSDNCLLRLIYLLSTSGYIYLHTRLLRYSFRKSIPFCHFLILLISIPFVSVIKSCLQLEHDPHFRCFTTVVSPCVFSSYFDVDFHCFFSLFLTVFSFLLPSMQLLFLSFSNDITFGDFGIVSSSYSCPFVSLLSSCPIFFTNNTTVRATLCQLSFLPIRPHVPSLGCSIGQLPLLRCFVASPFACFARLLLSLATSPIFLTIYLLANTLIQLSCSRMIVFRLFGSRGSSHFILLPFWPTVPFPLRGRTSRSSSIHKNSHLRLSL